MVFTPGDSALTIPGPVGDLQAIVTCSETSANDRQNVSIVCHPHSLMGGTMNNKVVHTVARARRDLGHVVVRFNFRGVEKSEGAYADGIGEQDDLLAVLAWVTRQMLEAKLHLAGFSFGAFVSAATCQRAIEQDFPIEDLLLVAPAVVNYPFDKLTQFSCPLTLIYGDADEVVDSDEIKSWYQQVSSTKQVHCLAGAGHFFHGRLVEVKKLLLNDQ